MDWLHIIKVVVFVIVTVFVNKYYMLAYKVISNKEPKKERVFGFVVASFLVIGSILSLIFIPYILLEGLSKLERSNQSFYNRIPLGDLTMYLTFVAAFYSINGWWIEKKNELQKKAYNKALLDMSSELKRDYSQSSFENASARLYKNSHEPYSQE